MMMDNETDRSASAAPQSTDGGSSQSRSTTDAAAAATTTTATRTIIRPYGYAETDCGYCKGKRATIIGKTPSNCSKSYSVLADAMTPEMYEAFMNYGWRRSGVHLYKPSNFESCCPTITIRLNTRQFHPTKSQRKVLRKMNALVTNSNNNSNKNRPSRTDNQKNEINHRNKDSKRQANTKNNEDIEAVRNSGLLEELEIITKEAVIQSLPSMIVVESNDGMTKSKSSSSSSSSSWKTSYRLLQQSKQDRRVHNTVTGVSSVCAQVGGMYKISREELVENVVKNIHTSLVVKNESKSPNDSSSSSLLISSSSNKNGGGGSSVVEVTSIEAHRPSGQIRTTFRINKMNPPVGKEGERNGKIIDDDCDNDVTMEDESSHQGEQQQQQQQQLPQTPKPESIVINNTASSSKDRDHDNKLDQWYRDRIKTTTTTSAVVAAAVVVSDTTANTTITSLVSIGDGGSDGTTNQTTNNQKKPRLLLNDDDNDDDNRRITITTLAAHESALLPEVHRLYTYYQHTVHDDPNPFVMVPPSKVTIQQKEEQSSDNGGQEQGGGGGGGSGINATEVSSSSDTTKSTDVETMDDPDSHNRSKDDDNNNSNESNNDMQAEELDSSHTVDPSQLDWGNAPDYFKQQIVGMLREYLQGIDESKIRYQVLKNYYSFYQFLVEAPFPFTKDSSQQTEPIRILKKDRGLYHQHYRFGDVLIAVGVVDILPTGLSSVYLYYDPKFSHQFVPLGKYAILKEIEFTRDTLKLPYYYLGYYIESCQKMRYKAEYHPSELLCPRYYQWVSADTAIHKLQQTPHNVCSLVDNNKSIDDEDFEDTSTQSKLNRIEMDIGAGMNVTMDMLQPNGVDIVQPILKELYKEAGPDLALQCLVKLT